MWFFCVVIENVANVPIMYLPSCFEAIRPAAISPNTHSTTRLASALPSFPFFATHKGCFAHNNPPSSSLFCLCYLNLRPRLSVIWPTSVSIFSLKQHHNPKLALSILVKNVGNGANSAEIFAARTFTNFGLSRCPSVVSSTSGIGTFLRPKCGAVGSGIFRTFGVGDARVVTANF